MTLRALLALFIAAGSASAQDLIGGSSGGGGGSPGGSDTQLQYNNSSSFGGITGSVWDGTYLTLPNFTVGAMRCTASAGVMTCQDPTATTGDTSFIVKGGAGQSLNPLEVQTNTGDWLARIPNDGGDIAIGYRAGYQLTISTNNILIGHDVFDSGTRVGSDYNVMIGTEAASFASGSAIDQNVIIGYTAGRDINGGDFNVYVGQAAGQQNNDANASENVNIGYQAGQLAAGSNNVFLGATAGKYETAGNTLFIDNQSRTDEATSRTSSLIYGVFNATPSSQTLHLNANVRATYGLEVGSAGAIIHPPSATEPVDCTTSNDGSMYFDTTDQTMCVCANDGADEWQKITDMTTDCSI